VCDVGMVYIWSELLEIQVGISALNRARGRVTGPCCCYSLSLSCGSSRGSWVSQGGLVPYKLEGYCHRRGRGRGRAGTRGCATNIRAYRTGDPGRTRELELNVPVGDQLGPECEPTSSPHDRQYSPWAPASERQSCQLPLTPYSRRSS